MSDAFQADPNHEARLCAREELLDILQRYDELAAEAKGDASLRQFWRLSKRKYQEDFKQVELAR